MLETHITLWCYKTFLQHLGGGVHQCGLFSVWDVSELSYPPSSPWMGSCASPLLWHPHLCSLVLGCTRVEQWTTGAVRDDHLRTLQSPCDTPICIKSIVSCAGDRWLIERRVAGTKQVSTVGHLAPDPPPLSFLDSSSALSPWTSYQYRLVLHNQAGNTTGKAIVMSLSELNSICPRCVHVASFTEFTTQSWLITYLMLPRFVV